ncbi:hypothetical protein KJ596_04525 [Patescibacteria group bacterium]|nr:hypothetical protein [Patescibacteria group bacterium]MBU1868571.1 hypothetical protein [Patescibacteria group bacterium]
MVNGRGAYGGAVREAIGGAHEEIVRTAEAGKPTAGLGAALAMMEKYGDSVLAKRAAFQRRSLESGARSEMRDVDDTRETLEERLFSEGMLEVADKSEEVEATRVELNKYDKERLVWERTHAGKVPAPWSNWIKVARTLDEAGAKGIQLSELLLDAACSHYHATVVYSAAQRQALNAEQIAAVIGAKGADWWRDEVVGEQRARGVDASVIDEGVRIADEGESTLRPAVD